MTGNKIKNGLLFLLFSILFLPMLQKAFPFIKSAPLNGEYIVAADTIFTPEKWFDGIYWNRKSKYINDNMGLRPDIIRLNNQVDFSLFKKIHSEWRLLGENSCIFQDVYIYSYLGRDYDGYPYIQEKVRKLKAIQDTLGKLGKSLVFIHAPCKAFYYPEYFPKRYKDTVKCMSNYEAYKKIGDSLGLEQIDFNAWFRGMKNSSPELLYPKQGFHWSAYGSLIAADSLTRYIERRQNIHMIHPVWDKIEHTDKPRYKDDDIARSMNLVWPLAHETFSYPELRYTSDRQATKPRVIYIGDSFLFEWTDQWVLQNTDSTWHIWYYNQSIIDKDNSLKAMHMLNDSERIRQIDDADCIVIMFTSRNMSKMDQGFAEQIYQHFYPGNK